jgi:argininosuccinate synthase
VDWYQPMTRIVFAYDGSAAGTAAMAWLRQTAEEQGNGPLELVTLTLDLGQHDELEAVRERALAAGAERAHVLDVREIFAHSYLLPALRAGAACDDGRPVGRVLSRPVIARQLVDVAHMEGTDCVAHGAWRDAVDRARLERAILLLAPSLDVRAPLVEWGPTDEQIEAFTAARHLQVPHSGSHISADLWGRCARVAMRADLTSDNVASVYVKTKSPDDAPDDPAYVDIEFERGAPVGISGVGMPFLEIISSLETIAGAHSVGRSEGRTQRIEGVEVREFCESPAATVLDDAHRALTHAVLPEDVKKPLAEIRGWYADLVQHGAWASVTREACQAFVDRTQAAVTGSVRLQLSHGRCAVVGVTPRERKSQNADHADGRRLNTENLKAKEFEDKNPRPSA